MSTVILTHLFSTFLQHHVSCIDKTSEIIMITNPYDKIVSDNIISEIFKFDLVKPADICSYKDSSESLKSFY